MKSNSISHIKAILADRHIAVVLFVLAIMTLVFCVYVGITLQPSDLQVVTHYTSFGSTNFYRGKWYYLITFIAFGGLSLLMYIVLTGKIFLEKGRGLALPFAWLGLLVLFIAFAVAYQVLKIAALS